MSEQCPVCGGYFEEGTGSREVTHDGQTFKLCSQECEAVFVLFPDAYAGDSDVELKVLEDTAY
jgi:YHS domain-containing protein